MKIYYLPQELRDELRRLYGTLYRGEGPDVAKQIIKDLNNPTKVISVGDIVTFNLLNAGLVPDVSIVDDRTMRGPASDEVIHITKHPYPKTITVENPPGMITEELLQAISKALDSDTPVRILVRGEEDLAAMPAIALAPLSSVVIYGLPDEGAVLVRVTADKKKEIQSLIDRMRCKEENIWNFRLSKIKQIHY